MSDRILVAYNEPVLPPDHPDSASEVDIVETSALVESMLKQTGWEVKRIAYSTNPRTLLKELRLFKPDVIFNLFEGLANRTETEIGAAAFLEWLDLPFTGSPSWAIATGRDKIRTKYLLQGAKLPTAEFIVAHHLPCPNWPHPWPAIVKPATQDCSVGIEQASVVTNQQELNDRVEWVFRNYGGPVLIEKYIAGREFHLNMFESNENVPLWDRIKIVPPAEIIFEPHAEHRFWPIYSFTAKWNEHSQEFNQTDIQSVVPLPENILEKMTSIAKETYLLLGLRDYCRLDVRLGEDGIPYILEVNPNPYLNSPPLIDGLASMGITHEHFIHVIATNALQRRKVKRRRRKVKSLPPPTSQET
jgi:D-alanine-D-alanine ligase